MLPGEVQKIMLQMKAGKKFQDEWSSHMHNEGRTYKFDKKRESYVVELFDEIVGSHGGVKPLSDLEMVEFLCEMNVMEFINQGFEV